MFAVVVHHGPLTDADRVWNVVVITVAILCAAVSLAYRRAQRRQKWAEVLDRAGDWAESVGGRLIRVSEQPTVYGTKGFIIARRYRVTFVDGSGAECIATLQWTSSDDRWSMEKMLRDRPLDVADEPSSELVAPTPGEAELAAESYARRHRGRESEVPVIFAPPRRRRRPRRST
jgi:hypothetical protein